MQEINYRNKYLELRSKYMNDLDMAFRLGFEQGAQQAQQKQAIDAQAQAQEMEHQQSMAEANGMNGEQGQPGEGPIPPDSEQQPPGATEGAGGGSELDQHIGKLESMLGSGSPGNPEDVKKAIDELVSLRKAEKFVIEMKKSDLAIKGIAKALHKPSYKFGAQAQHNLTDNAKKAVSMQHKIVNDIFKSWKEEEDRASKDITNILNVENLLKE